MCVGCRGVTMHRCIDASRYMAPRYAYRIATQISRYFRRYNMRLNRDISAHVSRCSETCIAIHASIYRRRPGIATMTIYYRSFFLKRTFGNLF